MKVKVLRAARASRNCTVGKLYDLISTDEEHIDELYYVFIDDVGTKVTVDACKCELINEEIENLDKLFEQKLKERNGMCSI